MLIFSAFVIAFILIQLVSFVDIPYPSTEEEIDRINAVISNYFAAITAAAAAGGLIYTARSVRQQTKSQYAQILKDLQQELHELQEQRKQLGEEIFFVKYLNVLDRIAYLSLKRSIPNDIPDYFRLHYALSLKKLEEAELQKYKTDANYLIEWCKKHGVKKEECKL